MSYWSKNNAIYPFFNNYFMTSEPRHPVLVYAHVFLYFLGGGLHLKNIKPWLIRFFVYSVIISICIVYTLCFMYLLQIETPDFVELLLCSMAINCWASAIVDYSLNYLCKDELKRLLDIMNDEYELKDDYKEIQIFDRNTKVVMHLHMTYLASQTFFKPVICFFLRGYLSDQVSYSFPIPRYMIDWVNNSYLKYLFIYYFQLTPLVIPLVKFLSHSLFLRLVCRMFYCECLTIRNDLRNHYSDLEKVETIFKCKSSADGGRRDLTKERQEAELISRKFNKNLKVMIARYQKLVKDLENFQTYFVYLVSHMLILSITALIPLGYLAVMSGGAINLKVQEFNLSFVVSIMLYSCCAVGSGLEDGRNVVAEEIYNIPWYLIPASQRKTTYIFVCQTQNVRVYKALKIYPILMVVFPRIMNSVYSSINILLKMTNR